MKIIEKNRLKYATKIYAKCYKYLKLYLTMILIISKKIFLQIFSETTLEGKRK